MKRNPLEADVNTAKFCRLDSVPPNYRAVYRRMEKSFVLLAQLHGQHSDQHLTREIFQTLRELAATLLLEENGIPQTPWKRKLLMDVRRLRLIDSECSLK